MLFLSWCWAVDIPVGPTQTFTTLTAALNAANDGDVLLIDPGVYPTPDQQWSNRTFTLRGAAPGVVIEATGSPLFRINGGGGLVLEDLTVDGAGANQLVFGNTNADVTVRNAVLRNGSAADGGLIRVSSGTLLVEDSALESSVATSAGGAISMQGVLTITGSTFTGNDAPLGAAIDVTGTAVTIDGTRFEAHTGALATIDCFANSCTLTDVVFQGNTVSEAAAVRFGNGTHAIQQSLFCANEGSDLVRATAGTLALDRDIWVTNPLTGPAVRVNAAATAQLVDLHLVYNSSPGALVLGAGPLDVRNALFAFNDNGSAALEANGGLTSDYNLFWANTGGDTSGTLGAGSLQADPLLVAVAAPIDCSTDTLVPYTDSPVIDAGDPTLLDADASRSDIGAFETGDAVPFVDSDGDGWSDRQDCDDDEPTVNPGQIEVLCSGLDEDCDPLTVDDRDDDSDGVSFCANDCDDSEPLVAPGFAEVVCSGLDEDCDPLTLDEPDVDGDGVGFCANDCDDTDPLRAPTFSEVTCNGIDEDCDPATIDSPDADADGVSTCDGDCNDNVASIYPGAEEVPYDGIDQDCLDGDLVDVDGDGWGFTQDCDESEPTIHPQAEEIADDGIDQDCSGFDTTYDLTGRYGVRCGCSAQTSTPLSWGWLRR